MITLLRSKIKEAMIDRKNTGDGLRYQTLKNVLEKAQKTAKDQRTEIITDSMIIDAAKKEIKQHKDLLEFCTEGTDKYNETVKCIGYAEELLPKMASEDDILAFLSANRAQIGNMGAAMKLLKAEFGDSLDGKMASGLAKKFLG